ncbi:MAG: nucleoside hydrolase [Candidatus Hydrogenedentes bacterium]|nr:nucleoside hydrolase [Candidatus Hydrogenedentota bacterium]
MISLLCLQACLMSAAATPVSVILDTDIGDDIDDTWALAMLLGCPNVDLKLIVTASDDTPTKTRLVAKILERAGRTDIPIGTGVKNSDNPINQKAWLGDYDLKSYKGKVYEDGVAKMIEAIKQSPGVIPLLVIGPQTNIKEALRRDPEIAKKARIVAMAGSVEIGYAGKQGRDPEWNVLKDVAAARAVFAAPWEITIAPLDSCGTLTLSGERYAAVEASSQARTKALVENYRQWSNFDKHPKGSSSILFDTVAAYLTFDEALLNIKTVKLSIDDKGVTVPDEKGRPVRCALNWKDRDGFEKLLVKTLTVDRKTGRE